jgi:hypothetical protein
MVSCDCLERVNLKVEKELDRLRGEFRKKEASMMTTFERRLKLLENYVIELQGTTKRYQEETRDTIQIQEVTVSFILNSVQSLTHLLHA